MKALELRITNFDILMKCELFELDNGLRIAFQEDSSIQTVHCGFLINAGSRDELENEHGLAHLIEHCLFKGTANRKAFHILSRLDSVGGEINAYTTKEETCVYASSMNEHFHRASELLFDIVFAASFPDKEIAKEISVIRDEINSYKDNPDEMLMDEFEEKLFPNHPFGRTILGTETGISQLNQQNIRSFVDRLYSTDQIVFSCVGNISRKKLMRFATEYLEKIPKRIRGNIDRTIPKTTVFDETNKRNVNQVHTLLGGTSVGLSDDKRSHMILLNNILGGPALNSRLNLNIREKLGYCYHIESNFNPYSDLGVFQIYFGTDPAYYKRTSKLVRKEMNDLMDKALTPRALAMAQKQLLGQIALSQEQRSSIMISTAKSLLHFGRLDTFEEVEEKIMEINASDLQSMAIESFQPNRLSSLSFIPEKQ
jgi:predicted Zn-dependent peptidase